MLSRRTRTRRAAAAVELAALLPFIAYICIIATDWARLFYYTITIEQCARNGALYAADPATQPESGYASVTEASLASAPGLNPTPTVTAQDIEIDRRPAVEVTVTLNFKTITNFPGVPRSETLVRKVTMRKIPVTPQ